MHSRFRRGRQGTRSGGILLLGLKLDGDEDAAATALNKKKNLVILALLKQVVPALEKLAVSAHEDVAGADAGLGGRAGDLSYEQSGGFSLLLLFLRERRAVTPRRVSLAVVACFSSAALLEPTVTLISWLLSVAEDRHRDFSAGTNGAHQRRQRDGGGDLFAVERQNDVTFAQTGLFGGTVLFGLCYKSALRRLETEDCRRAPD